MFWIVLTIVAVAVVGVTIWVLRRKRQPPIIAFVGFLREPVSFDPAILANAVKKAWNADVGTGGEGEEGPDGFMACTDVISTIMHNDEMVLVNSFPKPYVDDPEALADQIPDLRLKQAIAEHTAWFSCDALGTGHGLSDAEKARWYRKLGQLFAELVDDNCLMIFVPETSSGFPYKPECDDALRAKDPLKALGELLEVPIVGIDSEDPRMQAAVAKAREQWPDFAEAYEAKDGSDFAVKAPITVGENTEFIWISVTSLEGGRIYGTLGNEPHNLGKLRLGSKVHTTNDVLNDWCYIDGDGEMVGGFTVKLMTEIMKK